MPGYPGTHGGHAAVGRRKKSLDDKVLQGTATLEQRSIVAEQKRDIQQQGDDAEHTSSAPPTDYVPMPSGLRADEKRIWSQLAPYARAAHTLVPQTVVGFRNLVETRALRLRLRRKVDREGWTVNRGPLKGKRHPLITMLMQLQDKETSALLRFSLHAAGREMDSVDPLPTAGTPGPVDKWAEFDTPPPVSLPETDAGDDATTH